MSRKRQRQGEPISEKELLRRFVASISAVESTSGRIIALGGEWVREVDGRWQFWRMR